VLFYSRGFNRDSFPANEMKNVDLSQACLRWAEFRGLDLESVVFPTDEEHIVAEPYIEIIDHVIQMVQSRGDDVARRVFAVFANLRKWAGPRQRRGVFNTKDLREIGGDEAVRIIGGAIEAMTP
jgi:hypothetical protein